MTSCRVKVDAPRLGDGRGRGSPPLLFLCRALHTHIDALDDLGVSELAKAAALVLSDIRRD